MRAGARLYESFTGVRWTVLQGPSVPWARGRAPQNPHRSPAGIVRRRAFAVGARCRAGADAERELPAHGAVHRARARRPERAHHAASGRALPAQAAALERRDPRHRARHLDAEGHLGHGHGRGRQRRPLQLQRRPPERDVHAGQGADEPALPRALERRHRVRRQAQRRARLVLRLLAGPRPAPAADRPEPAAPRRRHLALHAGLGRHDAEDPGRVRGRAAAVPAGGARHRPDRRRHLDALGRRPGDPEERRGAARTRLAGREAPGRGDARQRRS